MLSKYALRPLSLLYFMILTLSQKASSGSEKPLWAVCTSGLFVLPPALLRLTFHSATREYAAQALNVVGIPDPRVFVAAQDVQKGKPQ